MFRHLAFAAALAFAATTATNTADAQSFPLSGTSWQGFQETKAALSGLGKDRSGSSLRVVVLNSSRFSATDASGTYTGNYSVRGKNIDLNFDSTSLTTLANNYENWIEGALASIGISVEVDVRITSFRGKAKVKESRRGTFLQVQTQVKFEASAPGLRTRKGKAKMKGLTQLQN